MERGQVEYESEVGNDMLCQKFDFICLHCKKKKKKIEGVDLSQHPWYYLNTSVFAV